MIDSNGWKEVDKLKANQLVVTWWLYFTVADENKYFGAILESSVVFLLDTSSSMTAHLQEMKDGLIVQLNNMSSKTKRY